MKLRKLTLAMAGSAALAMAQGASAAPADIGTIVDESGSMSGEQAWLPNMIAALESGLNAAGVGDAGDANRYGTVGYGSGGNHGGSAPHSHLDNGGSDGSTGDIWQAAGDYGNTTPGFTTSGSFEDGYAGIDYFLNNYDRRANAATNVILATDEDRDNGNPALTYASILAGMTNAGALLNAVVNVALRCGDNTVALGIDSDGNCYKADGLGGFTAAAGGTAIGGFGSTVADYVNLALATGGAAWDLNQLRAGGLTATSFTNAFVAIKVKEIEEQNDPQPVPEPSALALLGLGMIGFSAIRRRRNR